MQKGAGSEMFDAGGGKSVAFTGELAAPLK